MDDNREWSIPEGAGNWWEEPTAALPKIQNDMAQTSLKFGPKHWESLGLYLSGAECSFLLMREHYYSRRSMTASEMRKVLKQIEALEESLQNHWFPLLDWANAYPLSEQLTKSKQGLSDMLSAKSLGGVHKPEYALFIGDLVEHIKADNLPIKLSASKDSHFDLLVTSIFRHLFAEEADSYHKHIAKVLAEK